MLQKGSFLVDRLIIKAKSMNKSLLIRSVMVGLVVPFAVSAAMVPQATNTGANEPIPATLVYNGHLTICKIDKSHYEVVKTIKTYVTGYSSTPDQTDDTPFITASGKDLRKIDYRVIANNKLPFGSKVRIPEYFGDEIFTVEDRMHQRMKHFDVYFKETQDARNFGARITTIEVLES